MRDIRLGQDLQATFEQAFSHITRLHLGESGNRRDRLRSTDHGDDQRKEGQLHETNLRRSQIG